MTSTLRWFGLSALMGLSAAVSTSCSPPVTRCDSTTCANGCCAAGQCVMGNATNACGSRGNMCVACPVGFACMSGACTPANAGGGTAGGTAGGSTAGGTAAATNFMVMRLGTGAAALSSASTAVFLEERSLADGALVRTVDVSTNAAAPGFGMSGTATSEGALTRSGNGAFVVLTGYQAALGTASIASSTVPRVIVRVDAAGTVSSGTLITDSFLTNNLRGAATNDGTGYWTAGAGNADAGIRFVTHNGAGATTPVFLDVQNNRSVLVSGGQVYAATSGLTGVPDGGSQIYSLGALPMSTASYAALPGVDVTAPNSFVLLDLSPNVPGLDALYTSDTATGGNGGVRKYSFNGTTWSLAWRANTAEDAGASTCSHVTAGRTGNDVVVLCVRGDAARNLIVKYVEAGGNATVAPTGVGLVSAPMNMVYRGIAISPQ